MYSKKEWVAPVLEKIEMASTRASTGCTNETVNKNAVGPEKVGSCAQAS
jgi:hypothetical protein